MLNQIAGDKSSSASETGLAVNSNGAGTLLAQIEKCFDDAVAWRAAVDEEQVDVLEAGVNEPLGVVDLLVEAHDAFDVVLTEVTRICFGCVQRVAVLDFALGVRPRERQELLWHDPVQVTVFYFLFFQIRLDINTLKRIFTTFNQTKLGDDLKF